LIPTLEAAYVWHASKFTREVLDGLLRVGFLHLEQGQNRANQDALLVPTRALLVCTKEERALVWQGRRKLKNLGFTEPEIHHGRR